MNPRHPHEWGWEAGGRQTLLCISIRGNDFLHLARLTCSTHLQILGSFAMSGPKQRENDGWGQAEAETVEFQTSCIEHLRLSLISNMLRACFQMSG